MRQRTEFVLTPDELEQAIIGPAERIGLSVEPRLVATIGGEIGDQPGTLPLLQYALTELFEQRVSTLTIANNIPRSAAFSPDGSRLGTVSWQGEAKIWDTTRYEPLLTLNGHEDEAWDIVFSPDGKWVVTAGKDETARLWDVATGEEMMTLEIMTI